MGSLASDDIAIVGIGCRLPGGADSPEKYWQLLAEGRDAWSQVPSDRWNEMAFHHSDPSRPGMLNQRGGYFINQDLSTFDPAFFGISGEEAKSMDPQQRLALETSYEALENAGIPIESLKGSNTAVYMSAFTQDYERLMSKDPSAFHRYHVTGTENAFLSNRLSFVYDLRGPSMTINTACSGSLVALHQACQSLRIGESSLALVGASSLALIPDQSIFMSLLGVLNGDGKCYSFDYRGSGYARSEGVAVIVLKRLDEALASGDNIRAVIRGTGVNHDGKTTAGMAVPSKEAQERLIQSVYARTGLSPSNTQYLEAHATGTVVGDTIEFEAAKSVFGGSDRKRPLKIGSVKSNIGHLEPLSGLAGLIKVVLMLEKDLIPPHLNFEEPKAGISFDQTMELAKSLQSWSPTPSGARVASVNSFGYGGTNAHVVLESTPQMRNTASGISSKSVRPGPTQRYFLETDIGQIDPAQRLFGPNVSDHAPNGGNQDGVSGSAFTGGSNHEDSCPCRALVETMTPDSSELSMPSSLIVLTANSESSLRQNVDNLYEWAASQELNSTDIQNLAYALCSRRSVLPWRTSFLVHRPADFQASLQRKDLSISKILGRLQTTFIFTGQGAQWAGMGKELLGTHAAFRVSLEASNTILAGLGAVFDLLHEITAEGPASRVNESQITQPATTALQIALVDLWDSIGIRPSIVVGHSSGEIAAAYAAHALSHTDALKVAYHRGFVSSICGEVTGLKGAMLAVGLSPTEAATRLERLTCGEAAVACLNSPSSVTVSGDASAIEEFQPILNTECVFNRRLAVETGYHSHHMQRIASIYRHLLQGLEHGDTRTEFISTVTEETKKSGFGPDYWVENLVSPVRFSNVIAAITSRQMAVIELGPHGALAGPVRQTFTEQRKSSELNYVSTLTRDKSAVNCILECSGKLFQWGLPVDLATVQPTSNPGPYNLMSSLPTYAWDHSDQYWHESKLSHEYRFRQDPPHYLLGTRLPALPAAEAHWRNTISVKTHAWLRDHVIENSVIFPAAAYLCMALEAFRQLIGEHAPFKTHEIVLRDVAFLKALVLPDPPSSVELLLVLRESESQADKQVDPGRKFAIFATTGNGSWNKHCKGLIAHRLNDLNDEVRLARREADRWHNQKASLKAMNTFRSAQSNIDFYAECQTAGNSYGPAFRLIQDIKTDSLSSLARVSTFNSTERQADDLTNGKIKSPGFLDCLLQTTLPLFFKYCRRGPMVPVGIEELRMFDPSLASKAAIYESLCSLTPLDQRNAIANIITSPTGGQENQDLKISISGLELHAFGEAVSAERRIEDLQNMTFSLKWVADAGLHELANIIRAQDISEIESQRPLNCEKSALVYQLAAFYMNSAVEELVSNSLTASKDHLQRQFAWFQNYVKSKAAQNLLYQLRKTDIRAVEKTVRNLGAEGEAVTVIGQALTKIFTGQTSSLTLLMENNLAERVYAMDSCVQTYQRLAAFIGELARKKPCLKVLEIGAGTGSITLPILQAHTAGKDAIIGSYTYTDISSGFFDQARSKFRPWISLMEFRTLDIERDPISQGFKESTYDLVLAANVIHATSRLNRALSHVRKLLKPSGVLGLAELLTLNPPTMMLFGGLQGWWAGVEDGREQGPLLDGAQWTSRLEDCGFGKPEVIDIDNGESFQVSLIACESGKPSLTNDRPTLQFLGGSVFGEARSQVAERLCTQLENCGFNTDLCSWPPQSGIDESIFVIVDIRSSPLLSCSTDHSIFRQIQEIVGSCRRLMWLKACNGRVDDADSNFGLVAGFLRTVQAENPDIRAAALEVSLDGFSRPDEIGTVLQDVIQKAFLACDTSEADIEFRYVNGTLLVPRLSPEPEIDSLASASPKRVTTSIDFHESGRRLKLGNQRMGSYEDCVYEEDTIAPESALSPDALEVQVFASAIDSHVLLTILQQARATSRKTGECAGVVVAVGHDISNRFNIGDRVCAFGAAPLSNRVRVKGSNAAHIPSSVTFTAAASIPSTFCSAYAGLMEIARLQTGESVLVHTADRCLSEAAIQVARHAEAKIYATVGTTEERQALTQNCGITAENIFTRQPGGFANALMSATGGCGVDIVFCSSGDESLNQAWDCVKPFGDFVEINIANTRDKRRPKAQDLGANKSYCNLDLTSFSKHKPDRVQEILKKVVDMVSSGVLQPVHAMKNMDIGEVVEAFRLVRSENHSGKIVFDAQPLKPVNAIISPVTSSRLSSAATYVIAGGLGDLGLLMARSMARLGAGHVALLSRRSLSINEEEELKTEFISLGSKLHLIRTDIVSVDEIQRCFSFCKAHLPPIKGIVQAAMKLSDHYFSNMGVEDFNSILAPKVKGTLNLIHAAEHLTLDFFLTLSSLSSILGLPAQANYAAANSFMDDLAHTFHTANTPITSLNLGIVADSAFALANEAQTANVSNYGFLPLKTSQLITLFEHLITTDTRSSGLKQILWGMNSASLRDSKSAPVLRNPLYRALRHSTESSAEASKGERLEDLKQASQSAKTSQEAQSIIQNALTDKITSLLALKKGDISQDTSIQEIGMDSLVAVEFRKWITASFDVKLPLGSIIGAETFADLAIVILAETQKSHIKEWVSAARVF